MALPFARHAPGQADVNTEFSAAHIMQTLKNFNQLRKYEFGDLTAVFCNLDHDQNQTWKNLIAGHYPQDVQDEIKRTIVHALTQKNKNGQPDPIPISFDWKGPRGTVTVTYHSAGTKNGPSFAISLGFDPPIRVALRERRERAKQNKSKRKE